MLTSNAGTWGTVFVTEMVYEPGLMGQLTGIAEQRSYSSFTSLNKLKIPLLRTTTDTFPPLTT